MFVKAIKHQNVSEFLKKESFFFISLCPDSESEN